MQRNPRYYGNAPPDDAYEYGGYGYDSGGGGGGGYYNYGATPPQAYGAPVSGYDCPDFPAPLNNVEFRPSETCPRNFVIFDQTYHRSQVMFHPSLAHKFGSPGLHACGGRAPRADETGKSAYRDNDEETEDIDALLSSEEGEDDDDDDDDDDDVVSTGRTPGGWAGVSSPDTACSSQSKSKSKKKQVSSITAGGGQGGGGGGSGKREKMKKMVKTLKGIIPGGDRMDTPAVLDEAVKYLKSLKVEVKKLGVKHS